MWNLFVGRPVFARNGITFTFSEEKAKNKTLLRRCIEVSDRSECISKNITWASLITVWRHDIFKCHYVSQTHFLLDKFAIWGFIWGVYYPSNWLTVSSLMQYSFLAVVKYLANRLVMYVGYDNVSKVWGGWTCCVCSMCSTESFQQSLAPVPNRVHFAQCRYLSSYHTLGDWERFDTRFLMPLSL